MGEQTLKLTLVLSLHLLSDEEGYLSQDGREKEDQGNGRCLGILSIAFFERGDQEDRSSQEYRGASKINFPDGSYTELWAGIFGSAHEGKSCGMKKKMRKRERAACGMLGYRRQ